MSETTTFKLELEQVQDFEFRVKFDWPGVSELLLDEPAPMGRSAGPNAARLVGAAVANCLSASLLFCLRKFNQTPGRLGAEVTGELARNKRGRMRIGRFDVTIRVDGATAEIGHFERCLQQFEDFCIVTESIRHGIPVGVRVVDGSGREVFASSAAKSQA